MAGAAVQTLQVWQTYNVSNSPPRNSYRPAQIFPIFVSQPCPPPFRTSHCPARRGPIPFFPTMSTRTLEVPAWAHEFKRKYLTQNIAQFVLHGNINDYVPYAENGQPRYTPLKQFLEKELFGRRDIVLFYDRAAGINFADDRHFGGEGKMRQDFVSTLKMFDDLTGNEFAKLSREPARAFLSLDAYFNLCVNQEFIRYLISHLERRLAEAGGYEPSPTAAKAKEEDAGDIVQKFMNRQVGNLMDYMETSKKGGTAGTSTKDQDKKLLDHLRARLDKPKSIAFVIEYGETIIPANAQGRPEEQMLLIFMQRWAKERKFLQADMTVVTLTEAISDINPAYVRNPHTHDVTLPYPEEADRLRYIQHFLEKQSPEGQALFEMKPEIFATNTAGLGLVHLELILSEAVRNSIPFTNKELMQKKKEMIENEAGGMLEFIETKYSLENVAGHKYAKKRLTDAATALKNGRPDVMPMGYLVNGPVGTGKTFMITCFANDIGVPMVMLKNFRGMYVGQSEGNLEKVLKILKAMSPVAVMIDEADAYLGNRNDGGGSGVDSRIFSLLATFMSNTENRGRIIWFLVTARPDLMPVDFKRQGRAEEHIALFYPETTEEKQELLAVTLRKVGLNSVLKPEDFDEEFYEEMTVRSGADMEAALTRAKFKAASLGLGDVTPDIVVQVFNDFLPPTYPEEIELMNLAAVLECTSKELLPPSFRDMPREEVLGRIQELKMRIR